MIENARAQTDLTADQQQALELRATWLRASGADEDEVAELCDPTVYPPDLREEEANVAALEKMARTGPSNEDLKRLAERYPPPADW